MPVPLATATATDWKGGSPQLRKELLVTPLNPDDALPLHASLPGEKDRVLVDDAMAASRQARLFEVRTDRDWRAERFYEWVDKETGVVLKLLSHDRDWSFEYERIRVFPQPASYFDEPPGYQRRTAASGPRVEG